MKWLPHGPLNKPCLKDYDKIKPNQTKKSRASQTMEKDRILTRFSFVVTLATTFFVVVITMIWCISSHHDGPIDDTRQTEEKEEEYAKQWYNNLSCRDAPARTIPSRRASRLAVGANNSRMGDVFNVRYWGADDDDNDYFQGCKRVWGVWWVLVSERWQATKGRHWVHPTLRYRLPSFKLCGWSEDELKTTIRRRMITVKVHIALFVFDSCTMASNLTNFPD